jgi:hypothetical protein
MLVFTACSTLSKQQFLFIFTGNTGMYSPLGGRIVHLMSPSYCWISVKLSVMISGCPMGIFPVLLIYGYREVTSTYDISLYLEGQGYVYVGTWECEFDREVRENDTLRNCVQQSEMINPLEPRDAFTLRRCAELNILSPMLSSIHP